MILRCNLRCGRLGVVEYRIQGPQIAIADDLVELLFGSDKGRGQPADYHLTALPVSDEEGQDAHSGARALDDVCRSQAAAQQGRHAQPVDGEAFFQAFQQAGRSRWMVAVLPLGQFLDARHACFGIEFPGRATLKISLVQIGQASSLGPGGAAQSRQPQLEHLELSVTTSLLSQ